MQMHWPSNWLHLSAAALAGVICISPVVNALEWPCAISVSGASLRAITWNNSAASMASVNAASAR